MKSILKTIRARLFRNYEMRLSALEANITELTARFESRLPALEKDKFQLEGKVNHIEVFYGKANNELAHQISEINYQLKQLREQPNGEWSVSCPETSRAADNSLYIDRFSSALRKM